jgi:hypothetical protein
VALYRLQLPHVSTTIRAPTPARAVAVARRNGWTLPLGFALPRWSEWRQTAPGQWESGAGLRGAALFLDFSSLPLD